MWVTLSVFGWVGTGINSFCHDFASKWQQDHPPHSDNDTQTSKSSTATDTTVTTTTTTTAPYISPYSQAPGGPALHSNYNNGATTFSIAPATTTITSPPPYVAPYSPSVADYLRQQQLSENQARREKTQDIYFAKLEVNKWETTIEQCTTTIADLEAKIADPNVAESEHYKLRQYQDEQRKRLTEARKISTLLTEKLLT